MGSWFSNFSIRMGDGVTAETVEQYLTELAAQRQYVPAASAAEADGGFAIAAEEGSGWLTVYSDLISLEDPKEFSLLAQPLSARLHTDVLGVSCYDSDYLLLNLINAEEKTDAWIGIGSPAGLGIRRRTGLGAWKKKVAQFPAFSELAKGEYVCAEAFLSAAAENLALPGHQSGASYEYLKDFGLADKARYLYFKLSDTAETPEPPKLVPHMYSGMPCFLGKPSVVDGVNVGGASRGLSVYFLGPYVEHDEITFSDVCFVRHKEHSTESVPFALEKIRLSDGQWAYYYHDPGFRIPPKVDERLPFMKRMRAISDRSIVVRFVPHGDPRKILDITVVLVPDKNPGGQTGWNVWHRHGSKAEFIARFNESWADKRAWAPAASLPPILREEDFD